LRIRQIDALPPKVTIIQDAGGDHFAFLNDDGLPLFTIDEAAGVIHAIEDAATMKRGCARIKSGRCVMELTRRDVEEALRELRKRRREVMRLRALAASRKDVEKLHQMMEQIQIQEKEWLVELKKCPR
jgi:hypothetical protein